MKDPYSSLPTVFRPSSTTEPETTDTSQPTLKGVPGSYYELLQQMRLKHSKEKSEEVEYDLDSHMPSISEGKSKAKRKEPPIVHMSPYESYTPLAQGLSRNTRVHHAMEDSKSLRRRFISTLDASQFQSSDRPSAHNKPLSPKQLTRKLKQQMAVHEMQSYINDVSLNSSQFQDQVKPRRGKSKQFDLHSIKSFYSHKSRPRQIRGPHSLHKDQQQINYLIQNPEMLDLLIPNPLTQDANLPFSIRDDTSFAGASDQSRARKVPPIFNASQSKRPQTIFDHQTRPNYDMVEAEKRHRTADQENSSRRHQSPKAEDDMITPWGTQYKVTHKPSFQIGQSRTIYHNKPNQKRLASEQRHTIQSTMSRRRGERCCPACNEKSDKSFDQLGSLSSRHHTPIRKEKSPMVTVRLKQVKEIKEVPQESPEKKGVRVLNLQHILKLAQPKKAAEQVPDKEETFRPKINARPKFLRRAKCSVSPMDSNITGVKAINLNQTFDLPNNRAKFVGRTQEDADQLQSNVDLKVQRAMQNLTDKRLSTPRLKERRPKQTRKGGVSVDSSLLGMKYQTDLNASSISNHSSARGNRSKMVTQLVTGKYMIKSQALSLEDFLRSKSQMRNSSLDGHRNAETEKAEEVGGIQEETTVKEVVLSLNRDDASTQTLSNLHQNDWASSKIFARLTGAGVEMGLESLIEECDLENEEDGDRRTLFYHYKRSRKIYSEVECAYHANILKKKMSRKDFIDEEHLYDIHFIALKTLGALMTLLLLYPQWRKIEQLYMDESQITPDNCIKVLVRAKKMYDAKVVLTKILKMVVSRDELKKDLDAYKGVWEETVEREQREKLRRTTQRVMSEIASLQEEHRIFKRPFIVKGQDYLEQLRNDFMELEDFDRKHTVEGFQQITRQ